VSGHGKNCRAVESVDCEESQRMMAAARNISCANFGKKIRFYAPSFIYYKTGYFRSLPAAFPSISVTGSSCALNCKHCNAKVLNTMFPVSTPRELFDLCTKLQKRGAIGCLISGGCLPNGSVPLGRFIGSIAKIKRDLGFKIVVHTGIIDLSTARRLKEAEIDAALIDIIGSNETIQEIYQLDVGVEDYNRSLEALNKAKVPFVPHVLVGLHYGELKGEFQALKMTSKYSPSAVIVIAFMPIRGTPMEKVNPPVPEDIARVLAAARLVMPRVPLVLGCMRPKGKHRIRTDKLAVRMGTNAIAFPAKEAIQLAESLRLEITFSSLCCSQIYENIKLIV
jgi:uncharacterized radical SAM superfamily protein